MIFDFDLSIIDSPEFKEDSVREEIINPILKKLGYRATGQYRIQRSKNLTHPYVMIGSKRFPVNIIPDYTLYVDDNPIIIIEAKAPSEIIIKSDHVEQAYSYAIHPDIKVKYYALCNGKKLVLYSINQWEPILDIDVFDIENNWDKVEKVLGPKYLLIPELRDFHPDYGLTYLHTNLNPKALQVLCAHYLQGIMMYEMGKYTGFTTTMLGDLDCLVSLDMTQKEVDIILSNIPVEISKVYKSLLSRAPFQIETEGKIIFTCAGVLGDIVHGIYEDFVPLVLNDVSNISYDSSIELH